MSAAVYNITIEQGATWEKTLTWKDANGTPKDLSGFTAKLQIWNDSDSATPAVDLDEADGITLGGAAGTIAIEIPSTVTALLPDTFYGSYFLELDSGSKVYRLLQGVVELSLRTPIK